MAQNASNFPKKGDDFGTSTSRFDTGLKDKAEAAATTVADKARDVASSVADKAREVASTVSDKAQEYASDIKHQAEHAAHKVGDTWDSGRHYVEERGFSGIADDLGNVIRRNPLPALLIGFGIGFMCARAMRD